MVLRTVFSLLASVTLFTLATSTASSQCITSCTGTAVYISGLPAGWFNLELEYVSSQIMMSGTETFSANGSHSMAAQYCWQYIRVTNHGNGAYVYPNAGWTKISTALSGYPDPPGYCVWARLTVDQDECATVEITVMPC